MTRPGLYRALYLFAQVEDAVTFVSQVRDGVVASFGQGDDQWEGLDLTDAGSTCTIHTRIPDHGSKLRHGRVSVEFRIPIDEVPVGYWFSPAVDDNLMTIHENGESSHGEPVRWGLLPQREVKS